MITFFRNLLQYYQFKKALKKAKRAGKGYIVANVNGKPWVFNRKGFLNLQRIGVIKRSLKWADVKEKQITEERIESWIS